MYGVALTQTAVMARCLTKFLHTMFHRHFLKAPYEAGLFLFRLGETAAGAKVYDDQQSVSNLAESETVNLYALWTVTAIRYYFRQTAV